VWLWIQFNSTKWCPMFFWKLFLLWIPPSTLLKNVEMMHNLKPFFSWQELLLWSWVCTSLISVIHKLTRNVESIFSHQVPSSKILGFRRSIREVVVPWAGLPGFWRSIRVGHYCIILYKSGFLHSSEDKTIYIYSSYDIPNLLYKPKRPMAQFFMLLQHLAYAILSPTWIDLMLVSQPCTQFSS
jgi:hypothetical protein